MIPRTIRIALPTGRRVEVRADLSVRVMLRSGLIKASDELALLDALDDVGMDDREQGRRLQDALVLHALAEAKPDLDGLAEAEFLEVLKYAIDRLTAQSVEDDDEAEVEAEDDAEEVLGVTEIEEPSLEDELDRAREESLPEVKVPASAEVLEKIEAMAAEEAEA